jgi:hypothetical protein
MCISMDYYDAGTKTPILTARGNYKSQNNKLVLEHWIYSDMSPGHICMMIPGGRLYVYVGMERYTTTDMALGQYAYHMQ